MGILRLLICGACHHRIKIITPDGHCTKYEPPLSVAEALVDRPNYAVFHSDAVRKKGRWARPLEKTTALVAGQLYFLLPLSERSATNLVNETDKRRNCRVSFSNTPSFIHSAVPERTLRPSVEVHLAENGVIRLKVLISKKQLKEMIEEDSDMLSMLEKMVSPLLKETKARREAVATMEDSSTWRPSLESISEL